MSALAEDRPPLPIRPPEHIQICKIEIIITNIISQFFLKPHLQHCIEGLQV